MEEKLLDLSYRKKIIKEIKSDENVQRKIVSYKKQSMQEDDFHQYVVEYLESKLDQETVQELSVFSNVNLQRRISKAESHIYKKAPTRNYSANGDTIEGMNELMEQIDLDTALRRANEAYKYQGQCILQMVLEHGKIKPRVLMPHHVDVIPNEMNPEKAEIYIISNFDNTERDRVRRRNDRNNFSQGDKYRDSINQDIGDYDDQQLEKERYYVWSKTYNFVMDGHGNLLDKETETFKIELDEQEISEEIMSPFAGLECLPFIDISSGKNFEFWVQGFDSLYDATIVYNVILTSEFKTVEMQGHAQPYYKGDANHMPENMRVGVDKLLYIPVDPDNPTDSEFGFANPGSDLSGIREFRESFLSSFLSSRGLDTSIVSGKMQTSTASSGVERLLQMIEKFEASQEDMALFKHIEKKVAYIVACYVRAFGGERDQNGELVLDEDFQLTLPQDPKEIEVNIEFSKPEAIQTEMESLEVFEKEQELGLSSRVHYLMEQKGMSMEEAIARIQEVDEFEGLTDGGREQTQDIQE